MGVCFISVRRLSVKVRHSGRPSLDTKADRGERSRYNHQPSYDFGMLDRGSPVPPRLPTEVTHDISRRRSEVPNQGSAISSAIASVADGENNIRGVRGPEDRPVITSRPFWKFRQDSR